MPTQPDTPFIAPVPYLSPRVLVADDDAASCRFLCDGLRSLGAQAQACADGTAALQHACAEVFDLLLLDCRMPGAGALQILTSLRRNPQAGSAECIAVATTAELAPRDRQSLLAAGFTEILLKPCSMADLRRVLMLVQPERSDACVLDDQAALTSTGDAATMLALRRLLREELILLEQELEPLSRDRFGFGERLHRLRSSCGFCGAAALSVQTIWLQQRLAEREATPAALTRFRKTLLTTLQALER
ncbi:response regulator [Rhodanobacter sp. B04]|uniref:response regulator n=1 Tax=Rhodanobacter sp. B04 TaxID=1945860 RepID=UPI000985B905|nr:response regulator [Rhodanobacter sp. B04]OOG62247.1 response regulator [Rhodanobacter sp. B04]